MRISNSSWDAEQEVYDKLDKSSRHFCSEWDYMAIDHYSFEWGHEQNEKCFCGYKRKRVESSE